MEEKQDNPGSRMSEGQIKILANQEHSGGGTFGTFEEFQIMSTIVV